MDDRDAPEGWTTEDELAVLHETTPAWAAGLEFLNALAEDEPNIGHLEAMLVPEVRPQWGDFAQARVLLGDLPEPGFTDVFEQPTPAVFYFLVVGGITESRQLEAVEHRWGHWLTLVDVAGEWKVIGFGSRIPLKQIREVLPWV